jgi:hypothetical protein
MAVHPNELRLFNESMTMSDVAIAMLAPISARRLA